VWKPLLLLFMLLVRAATGTGKDAVWLCALLWPAAGIPWWLPLVAWLLLLLLVLRLQLLLLPCTLWRPGCASGCTLPEDATVCAAAAAAAAAGCLGGGGGWQHAALALTHC
jgi:hypothetical protein